MGGKIKYLKLNRCAKLHCKFEPQAIFIVVALSHEWYFNDNSMIDLTLKKNTVMDFNSSIIF